MRPCGNKGLGPAIAMQAADRDGPWLAARRAGPGANWFDQRLAFAKRQPFRAAADDAAPDQPERRGADDAEQRYPVGYQREVDSEFVAAGDEFRGGVQSRVDQKEAVSIGQGGVLGALFQREGMLGANRARPAAMMLSAARSASVTGDPSALPSTFMAERLTARMAAPAWVTMSVSGSISSVAARGVGWRSCLIHELGTICCSSCLTIAAPCWQHAAAQCIKPSSMRDCNFPPET